jgi:hypothetical protein
MNLDLNSMDPWEFELLVGELLRADRGWILEVFAVGPDQGVDLRCLSDSDSLSTVVQCKRYAPSAFRALERAVRRETANLRALQPQRYVLATTVPLTPARKAKLAALLVPWLKDEGDIIGNDELQAACRRHPDVLRGFPRLWLEPLPLVQRFLNAQLHNRTDHFLEQLPARQTEWVNTPAYGQARTALERTHLVILSGQPGVGKTHLAQMLTLASIAQGFEPAVISEDIGEIEGIWNDLPQVFIFDDFLGQISLGRLRLNRNEAQRIRAIVRRIERSTDKRLILTTREYILSEAAEAFEGLEGLKRSLSKTTIRVHGFPRVVRAAIVASHLARAIDIDASSFLRDPRRFQVVDHRKFNPRAIEHALKTMTYVDDVATVLLAELENPWRTWRSIYTNLAADVRLALQVIYTVGPVAHYDLAAAIWARITDHGSERTFDNCIRVLTDSMIQVDESEGGASRQLRMVDPSVQDFLRHRLKEEGAELDRLLDNLANIAQLQLLDSQVGLSGQRALTAFESALKLIANPLAHDTRSLVEDLHYLAAFGAEVRVPKLAARIAPLINDVLSSESSSPALLIEALQAATISEMPHTPAVLAALEGVMDSVLKSTDLEDWLLLEDLISLWETMPPARSPEPSSLTTAAHALTVAVLDSHPTVEDANLLLDVLTVIQDDLNIDTTQDLNLAWEAWHLAGGDDVATARQNLAWVEMQVVNDRWQRWSRNQSDSDVDAALTSSLRRTVQLSTPT